LFLYRLDHGSERSGVAAVVTSLALLAMFHRLAQAKGDAALIDLSLFRGRGFSAAFLAMFLANGISFAGQMLIPVYLVAGCGLSPGHAGWLLGGTPRPAHRDHGAQHRAAAGRPDPDDAVRRISWLAPVAGARTCIDLGCICLGVGTALPLARIAGPRGAQAAPAQHRGLMAAPVCRGCDPQDAGIAPRQLLTI
jgi:hypothetical protein